MPARRRSGTVEAAARRDLAALPPMYRYSALAETYLLISRRMDSGVPTRELSSLGREQRQCWLALLQLAPAREAGDPGDELAERRRERMERQAADGG